MRKGQGILVAVVLSLTAWPAVVDIIPVHPLLLALAVLGLIVLLGSSETFQLGRGTPVRKCSESSTSQRSELIVFT